MKRIVVFLMVMMMLASCATTKEFQVTKRERNGDLTPITIEVKPYGIFNQKQERNFVTYKLSYGNIVWSVLFSQTLIVPAVLIGWYLWEPRKIKK